MLGLRTCASRMLAGQWAWLLKDYIDRAFMRKYGEDLPLDGMQARQGGSGKGGGCLLP